jgi:hypothetical protein
MDEKHQKIYDLLYDIKADTAVTREKVSKLEDCDAGTRLTKLETKGKVLTWVGVVLFPLVMGKDYIIRLFLG